MENIGLHPLDPSSPVGKLRLSLGDTSVTDCGSGQASYANFSDAKLAQLLEDAGGSILRAKAFAYAELAAIAAANQITIKTNDLGYSKDRTAGELRALSEFFSTEADKAEDAALDESLEIVGFTGGIPHVF